MSEVECVRASLECRIAAPEQASRAAADPDGRCVPLHAQKDPPQEHRARAKMENAIREMGSDARMKTMSEQQQMDLVTPLRRARHRAATHPGLHNDWLRRVDDNLTLGKSHPVP
jgi:hypothetical protein